MKRWILYFAALAVLLMLPQGQGLDVGKLEPAEILSIYIKEGATVVETDTGNVGAARNLNDAIINMKESANAEVYLDTVSFLLVTEETKALLPELHEILRPGTAVVLTTGSVEPKKLAEFLRVHNPEIRLYECIVCQPELPKLMIAGERCYLVQ